LFIIHSGLKHTFLYRLSQNQLLFWLKVINICEMKFSALPYVLSKSDDLNLRNKFAVFKSETKTNKSLQLVFITPYGCIQNKYSALIQNNLNIEDLFYN
jgi:hypothetical protein